MKSELSKTSLIEELERYAVTNSALKKLPTVTKLSSNMKQHDTSGTKLARPSSRVNFMEDTVSPKRQMEQSNTLMSDSSSEELSLDINSP